MNIEDPTKVLLIRPGATDLDEQGRITGTLDVPLSDLGMRQAIELAENVARYEVQAVYSSPSVAARDTAKEIAKPKKIRVRVVEQLRNIDQGLWQGKELEELRTTQPKIARQWVERPETICPPGGEPLDSAIPRIVKLLKKIRKKHKGQTIAMIASDPLASIVAAALMPINGEQTSPNDSGLLVQSDCGAMEVLVLGDPESIELDWLLPQVSAQPAVD